MTTALRVTTKMNPILVTGMPRSGTTWVGRMLVASGRVGCINEPFNLSPLRGAFRVPVDRWYVYITEENEQQLLPALAEALEFRYPVLRELRRSRSRNDVRHAMRIWTSFLRNRGRRAVVKEPHAVFSTEWFARRLDSDVVITVRHPAAVVSSWKRLGWSFDFAHLLEQRALLRDWLHPFRDEMETALKPSHDLVDRVALLWRVIYAVVAKYETRFPEFLVLRHEDLSREPTAQFASLYDLLGLHFTGAARTAVAASSSATNPSEPSLANPYATQIDSRANLENWKRRLSEDEILRIRRVTDDVAGRYYGSDEWE